MFRSRTLLGLGLVLALAVGTASATNGYFTHGTGTKSKALAGAGSADPQELLSIATNPAGLAELPQSVDAGLALFSPIRDYTTSASAYDGGCNPVTGQCAFTIGPNNLSSQNEIFFIPYVGMNWRLNEQNALAVAFYARGGMNTQWQGGTATFDPDGAQGPAGPMKLNGTYGNGTAGVDLMQGFLNGTYAWRTADKRFALGASAIFAFQLFQARGLANFAPYTESMVKSGYTKMPANLSDNGHEQSYGFGGSVGGIWNVSKAFSVGAGYTSKMSMSKLSNYADLFAGHGSFDIPSTGTLGLTVRPTDAVSLSFDYQKIWYSDVPAVHNPIAKLYGCPTIAGPSGNPANCLGGNNGPGFGWRDMSIYKFGAQWKYDDSVTYRAGFSFANSQPIPNSQMTFNILAPGVVETHFTAGFTNTMSSGNELNVSMMFAPSHSLKGPNNFDPSQTVEFSMHQIELEVGYSWKR